MATPDEITRIELKRYSYGIQLDKIMNNAMKTDKIEARKLSTPFTEEMIKEYRQEQNTPIVVEGKTYKYHPASTIPELTSEEDVMKEFKARDEIKKVIIKQIEDMLTGKQQFIQQIRLEEEADRRFKDELNSGRLDRKQKITVIARREVLSDRIHEIRREIQLIDNAISNARIDLRQIDENSNDIKVEKNRIENENKAKIKNYVEELNVLNAGQFNMEQQPNETEEEYLNRLNETAQLPANDYYTEQEAIIENMKRFKLNMKELLKSDTIIEGVMRSLDSDDVYEANKLFGGIKLMFLKKYGYNNKNVNQDDLRDFILKIINNEDIIKQEPEEELLKSPIKTPQKAIGRQQVDIPTYVTFGEVVIRYSDLLKKNVLAIRNKRHNKIAGCNDAHVSEELQNLVSEMLNGENPSEEDIAHLGKEQPIFNNLMYRAGIIKGVKKADKNAIIDELNEKFDMIKGEINSGNDNPQLLADLEAILIDLKRLKQVTSKDAKVILEIAKTKMNEKSVF